MKLVLHVCANLVSRISCVNVLTPRALLGQQRPLSTVPCRVLRPRTRMSAAPERRVCVYVKKDGKDPEPVHLSQVSIGYYIINISLLTLK